jgi:hypothetical protein
MLRKLSMTPQWECKLKVELLPFTPYLFETLL